MRIGGIACFALALCACSPRDAASASVRAARNAGAPSPRSVPAPSMLPDAEDRADVELGFIAGRRYEHTGVARLRPLSTSAADAAKILKGEPVRRLELEGGSFTLLWSYASLEARAASAQRDGAATRALCRSAVEVLFDTSGQMIQVVDSVNEDPNEDEEWEPTYELPDDLRPDSIGGRTRLESLRAVHVVWLVKHGGALVSGRAYDHARVSDLVPGATREVEARRYLGGDPVERAEYDDASYVLAWSYATQRLSTSLRARFEKNGLLCEIVSCRPAYIGLPRGASADLAPEPDVRRAPALLRTIDLTATH